MSFRDKPRVERLHLILRHASMQGLGALPLNEVGKLEETHAALMKAPERALPFIALEGPRQAACAALEMARGE